MSEIMSRWPVLLEHLVVPDDLDSEGRIRDEVVGQWVDAARTAYLDRCEVLREVVERDGLRLRFQVTKLPKGELLDRPAGVVTTAGATEILPESFVIAVRLRPFGGDREIPLDGACTVMLEDPSTGEVRPVTNDIRDELIGLAHAAQHFN